MLLFSKYLVGAVLGIILWCTLSLGNERVLDDFHDGLDPKWKEKIFSGSTSYQLVSEDNQKCIRATSLKSASALYYKLDFDPQEFPQISWKWKIDNVVENGDARTKAGDDYAARVYVVFPSVFFWNTKAINYIWANKLPQNTIVPSAYTGNAALIAVESGEQQVGKWIEETRNIVEDYKVFFNSMPPKAGGIAIMTDTDNTGGSASACYGTITLSNPQQK